MRCCLRNLNNCSDLRMVLSVMQLMTDIIVYCLYYLREKDNHVHAYVSERV